jgi:hypothetical protein
MSDSIKSINVWVFDCPEHGEEIASYCFRAMDDANRHRWFKYRSDTIKKIIPSDAEINSHIGNLLNKNR